MSSVQRVAASNADALGSCQALDPLMMLADELELDTSWVEPILGEPLANAVRSNRRVPWEAFIAVVAGFGDRFEPHGGWELLHRTMHSSSIGMQAKSIGLIVSPALLYRLTWTWFGPTFFPHLISTFEQLSDTEFFFTLEIPAPHAYDEGYFQITRVMLAEMPCWTALERASVELEVDDREARFRLKAPEPRTLVHRARKWFSTLLLQKRLESSIQHHREQALEGYASLASTRNQLAASNAAHSRTVNAVQASVMEIDIQKDRLRLSDGFYRLFGLSASDPLSVDEFLVERTHESDRARLQRLLTQLTRGARELVEGDLMMQLADGEYRPVRMRAKRTDRTGTIAATFRDVGATFEATRLNRQALRRLERLIEVAPFAVLIHDSERVLFENPALERLPPGTAEKIIEMGTSGNDICGQTLRIDVPGESGETVVQIHAEMIGVDWEGESATLVVARDVTIERQLVDRSMLIDRKAATGTHAAGIAHEINNPLAYVQTNLDYVDEFLLGREGLDSAADAIQDARDGARRVREIVQTLKDFSRRPDGELVKVDLPDVIHRAVNVSWTEMRQRAELITAFNVARPVVADPVNLTHALVALLRNAIAAIPEDARGQIQIRVSDSGGEALVEVIDDGCGIPEEFASRVFDPFFTTRPPGLGAGMGLPLARSRIEGMGGSLRLRGRPEGGTIAEMTLPLAD